MTIGYESDDLDVVYQRAIAGGTGIHAGAHGIQSQSTIGLNDADLVVDGIPLLGFTFSVELPGA